MNAVLNPPPDELFPQGTPAQHLLRVPFARTVGIVSEAVSANRLLLRLPFNAAVADARGAIDLRAITALLDHAGGAVVYMTQLRAAPTATLDLRVAFAEPAVPGEDAICKVTVEHADTTRALVNATVRGAQSGRLLASGSGCFIIGAHPGQAPGQVIADPWRLKSAPGAILEPGVQFASFDEFLGVPAAESLGAAPVEIPFRPHLVGAVSLPALHGGVTAAALMMAAQQAMAQMSVVNAAPAHTTTHATTGSEAGSPRLASIAIQYLRVGQAKTLSAIAQVSKPGRRTSFVNASATQDGGARVVATAQCVFISGDGA